MFLRSIKIKYFRPDRILKKLSLDLSENADQFPELQGPFAGLRKYRVGNYRVIYGIIQEEVLILRIKHRKDVYKK